MTLPWPVTAPTAAHLAAFADASVEPFWLADASDPVPCAPLQAHDEADLCIIGGGFTGLWAAVHAKAEDPLRDVVLLESVTCGFGASGRNGGIVEASLTHGLANGLARFPREMDTLERIARQNYAQFRQDLSRYGIDCDFHEGGDIELALSDQELGRLSEEAERLRQFGRDVVVLDRPALKAEIASAVHRGGLMGRTGAATVHSGKLARGLRQAALSAGVRIYEQTQATSLRSDGAAVRVGSPSGTVLARRVILGTSAYPPLARVIRRYVAPVYDYVLVTEPLSAQQWQSVGWRNRQSLGEAANQFHYSRVTPDGRILWGGFDAVYRFRGPVGPAYEDFQPTFARLSQHFFTVFPQLDGLRFSHRWGGAIDTCSRFSVFFGQLLGGRVAYAAGYTGLGIAATRFGARVALDLVYGRDTELTRLEYVKTKPVPFPPEPLRSAVIQLTRNRMAAADRRSGRRGIWLRALDRFGLGFDS